MSVNAIHPILEQAAEAFVRDIRAENILPMFDSHNELEARRKLEAHCEIMLRRKGIELPEKARRDFTKKFADAAIRAR
jgi:hypothetical protein